VHQRRASTDFPLRSSALPDGPLEKTWDLPVCVRGASVHAQGLGPRGVLVHLAMAMDKVWPSALRDGVGTPFVVFSGLNTWPAHTPTNASPPASRLTTHSSGPAWIATPSPYETCIRYTAPPFRRTPRPSPHYYDYLSPSPMIRDEPVKSGEYGLLCASVRECPLSF